MKVNNIILQPLSVATLTFLLVIVVGFTRAYVTRQYADVLSSAVAPLGLYTARLSAAQPLLSIVVSALLVFISGLLVGRNTVRAELYPVRCYLAIPILGIVACGILLSADYLTQSVALLLLVLASSNFYNSFHRHYCFERMFRGSLYIGLIPLVYAPAVALLFMVLLAILLFQRTLREAVVAVVGMMLPMLITIFIYWASGYEPSEPLHRIHEALLAPVGYRFFGDNSMLLLVAGGMILFLSICSIASILFDIYTLRTKPRNILLYNFYLLCIVIGIYFVPGSTSVTLTLAAPAVAVLIPIALTKLNGWVASSLYVVLVVVSLLPRLL
jgi:hypothetical protein